MVTPLVEVAKDLKVKYPEASSRQISEVIINFIESDSSILSAIVGLTIPQGNELKTTELLINSTSQKNKFEKDKVLEKINNAKFFKKIQTRYTAPLQHTASYSKIENDGASVDILPRVKYSSNTISKITQFAPANVRLRQKKLYKDYYSSVVQLEPIISRDNSDKDSYSKVTKFIDEIENQVNKSMLLNLHDIYLIRNFTMLKEYSDQDLTRIQSALARDISLRNKTYKVSCISELYNNDKTLPEMLRVSRPKSPATLNLIYESVKAIILNEYKRIHKNISTQYIDGKIDYTNYKVEIEKWACNADELFSSIP